MHADGEIDTIDYAPDGTRIVARVDAALAAELQAAALRDAAAGPMPDSP